VDRTAAGAASPRRRGGASATAPSTCLSKRFPTPGNGPAVSIGRMATARVVERAVRATPSPAILVLDAEHLAPFKDPDAFLRKHGPEAWVDLLAKRE
jgi:hypothetical protein